MKVIATRVQRGVGQGGFHTSSILLQQKGMFDADLPFEFAYDCGTNSLGPASLKIDSFLGQHISAYEPADGIVDALFISHLDRDHYNGAEQLCKVRRIHRIFLPYFTIDELILLLLQQISSDIEVSTSFASSMASIATGGRTLFGIPVTVIGGTALITGDPFQRISPSTNGRLQAVLLGDDGKTYPIGDNIPGGANIGLVVNGQAIPWILRPWSYKQSAAAKKLMKDVISGVPELKNIRDQSKGISDADIANIKNNKDAIRSACQAIIAKSPGTIASDHSDNNSPSICLYSGPRSRITHRYATTYLERGTPESIIATNPIGWLTTGDMLMKRHWIDFITCYQDVVGLVGTFVIPHHGAENNHSPDFARAIAGRLAVICARQRSSHHPASIVLDELYANNAIVKVVDEYAAHGLCEVALLKTDNI